MKSKKPDKKVPKKQNFNYLQIDTADKIKCLIEKCQDSLDEDFVNLYKARKIIEKLIKNKFGEESDHHDQSPVQSEGSSSATEYLIFEQRTSRKIQNIRNMQIKINKAKDVLTLSQKKMPNTDRKGSIQ